MCLQTRFKHDLHSCSIYENRELWQCYGEIHTSTIANQTCKVNSHDSTDGIYADGIGTYADQKVADKWPKQPEPSTDVFCNLLPETKEGIRVDSRDARIIKQAQVLLTLQPATDDYYDPLEPQLLKYNRWKQLTRSFVMCLRWKNKRKGILNPVEIWVAEWALVRLSQAQCYRASLVQLRLNS
jgi:hypothetical protein